jgi:hypothetical protein
MPPELLARQLRGRASASPSTIGTQRPSYPLLEGSPSPGRRAVWAKPGCLNGESVQGCDTSERIGAMSKMSEVGRREFMPAIPTVYTWLRRERKFAMAGKSVFGQEEGNRIDPPHPGGPVKEGEGLEIAIGGPDPAPVVPSTASLNVKAPCHPALKPKGGSY